jgi:hypothetical protein
MKTLNQIFNGLAAIIAILVQQGFVIGLGLIVYAQSSLLWGIVVWCLTIPMVYLNIKTWKGIMKYGVILFFTTNRDTSSIDVKPEDNPYKEGI